MTKEELSEEAKKHRKWILLKLREGISFIQSTRLINGEAITVDATYFAEHNTHDIVFIRCDTGYEIYREKVGSIEACIVRFHEIMDEINRGTFKLPD